MSLSMVNEENFHQQDPEYKDALIRLMSVMAFGEFLAATEPLKWIKCAPSFLHRRVLSRIIAEEADHSYQIFKLLKNLGVEEKEVFDIVANTVSDTSLAGPKEIGKDDTDWFDVACNLVFMDQAGGFMVKNYTQSSYAPWAHICEKIHAEETLHVNFGFKELKRLTEDMPKEEITSRLTHWFALGLNFFGPPSKTQGSKLKTMGLKPSSNEEMRKDYFSSIMARFTEMGIADCVQFTRQEYPYA